jgi:polysaccharide pyruvyl transferase WcaK-like protein
VRYLILNAYSARNAGDAAIVLATAALLRDLGAAEVGSSTRYADQDRDFYRAEGVRVCPPVVPFPPKPPSGRGYGRALALILGIAVVAALVLISRVSAALASSVARRLRLEGAQALFECDRAVICGGGYLYSSRSRLNLTLVHAVVSVKLADLAGKRPIMMPQSIGPLPKRFDQRLVAWGFRRIQPIVVRDELARSEAREFMGRDPEDIRLCPDIAFYGWPETSSASRPRSGGPVVGLVVMDWTWARAVDPPAALNEYVTKLADLVAGLARDGYEVRLFGHSRIPEMDQDDVAIADLVVRAAGAEPRVRLDEEGATGDVRVLRRVFEAMSLVVGTRLHSCIIAMAAGTPALGLAYQPKTVGTYDLLGLRDLCLDVETFDPDELGDKVRKLLSGEGEASARVNEAVDEVKSRIGEFYGHLLRA